MSDQKITVSRRSLLKSSGMLAGAAVTGGIVGHALTTESASAAPQTTKLAPPPWKYVKLDPNEVAKQAYADYKVRGCMYAAVNSFFELLGKKVGSPYTVIPAEMFAYGSGGIQGWGTICGALNGAAVVLGLFAPKPDLALLVDELYNWYRNTSLPIFVPEGGEKKFLKTTPTDVLCHISMAGWTAEAEAPAKSPERKERCCRLAADVAKKTAEILNDYIKGKVPENQKLSGLDHDSNASVKMRCDFCHDADEEE